MVKYKHKINQSSHLGHFDHFFAFRPFGVHFGHFGRDLAVLADLGRFGVLAVWGPFRPFTSRSRNIKGRSGRVMQLGRRDLQIWAQYAPKGPPRSRDWPIFEIERFYDVFYKCGKSPKFVQVPIFARAIECLLANEVCMVLSTEWTTFVEIEIGTPKRGRVVLVYVAKSIYGPKIVKIQDRFGNCRTGTRLVLKSARAVAQTSEK